MTQQIFISPPPIHPLAPPSLEALFISFYFILFQFKHISSVAYTLRDPLSVQLVLIWSSMLLVHHGLIFYSPKEHLHFYGGLKQKVLITWLFRVVGEAQLHGNWSCLSTS